MKQLKDHAIVLSRINYGEKDRILTLLCQEYGKASVIAKSVRSQKSKLAGGIELLSESEVCFVQGKSELFTLTSARLIQHFDNLAKDIQRMQLAFNFLKFVSKLTQPGSGQDHYAVLLEALSKLNYAEYDSRLVEIWFTLRALGLSGSLPDFNIKEGESFDFDYNKQQFVETVSGTFSRSDLKLLRLCAAGSQPPKLQEELGTEDSIISYVRTLLRMNLTEA